MKIREKTMEEQIASLLRETIISMGGNPDHRACGNRDRQVLRSFAEHIMYLSSQDFYSLEEVSRALRVVIENKIG